MKEFLYIKPADDQAGICWAHKLPTTGLAQVIVDEMRRTHGSGGVNICVECVKRARDAVKPK